MAFDLIDPGASQQEWQRARNLRRTVVAWLVVAALIFLWFPLFAIGSRVARDNAALDADMAALAAQIEQLSTPAPDVQKMTTQTMQLRQLAQDFEAGRPPRGADWPAVVRVVAGVDPAQMRVTSFVQEENRITLTGEATDTAAVVAYMLLLSDSALFAAVDLEGITTIAPAAVADVAPADASGKAPPAPEPSADGLAGVDASAEDAASVQYVIVLSLASP